MLILTSIHAFIGLCIVRPPRVRMHNLHVYGLGWTSELMMGIASEKTLARGQKYQSIL